MYLPLVAIVVLTALAARRLARLAPAAARSKNAALAAAGVIVVVAFGALTVRRNMEYRSGVSIWQTVLNRRPQARAHENLAVQLRDAGRTDEAIQHLRIAAPEIPEAKHALGSALLERGETVEGLKTLEDFVGTASSDRDRISGREEIASALIRQGKIEAAIDQFQQVVSMAPSYARGRQNLAAALSQSVDLRLKQQQFPEAEVEATRLIGLSPEDSQAHNALGVALASQGRVEQAAKEFAEAVRLNPGSQQARDNLERAAMLTRRSTPPTR
jgi:tetratricopeptide (TPR) repeat protein